MQPATLRSNAVTDFAHPTGSVDLGFARANTDRMISLMSSIPEPVQMIVDLFTSELGDVRFGDVDAQALTEAANEVEKAVETVTAAQAIADEARGNLRDRQQALLQRAERALAYARVYAATNDALRTRLDAISLPRTSSIPGGSSSDAQPPRRPRGRPRKHPIVSTAGVSLETPPLPMTSMSLEVAAE